MRALLSLIVVAAVLSAAQAEAEAGIISAASMLRGTITDVTDEWGNPVSWPAGLTATGEVSVLDELYNGTAGSATLLHAGDLLDLKPGDWLQTTASLSSQQGAGDGHVWTDGLFSFMNNTESNLSVNLLFEWDVTGTGGSGITADLLAVSLDSTHLFKEGIVNESGRLSFSLPVAAGESNMVAFTNDVNMSAVPEPSGFVLWATGAAMVAFRKRRAIREKCRQLAARLALR